MFDQGLSPTNPDFVGFCQAWVDNYFPDADIGVKQNFVKNFTKTTRDKWKKKHHYTKSNLLGDNYYNADIVFDLPKPKPTKPAEPQQKGTLLFLSHECINDMWEFHTYS